MSIISQIATFGQSVISCLNQSKLKLHSLMICDISNSKDMRRKWTKTTILEVHSSIFRIVNGEESEGIDGDENWTDISEMNTIIIVFWSIFLRKINSMRKFKATNNSARADFFFTERSYISLKKYKLTCKCVPYWIVPSNYREEFAQKVQEGDKDQHTHDPMRNTHSFQLDTLFPNFHRRWLRKRMIRTTDRWLDEKLGKESLNSRRVPLWCTESGRDSSINR